MDRVLELINRTNQQLHQAASPPTNRGRTGRNAAYPWRPCRAGAGQGPLWRLRAGGFFCIRRRFNGTTVTSLCVLVPHAEHGCRTVGLELSRTARIPDRDAGGEPLDTPASVDWITYVGEFGEVAPPPTTGTCALSAAATCNRSRSIAGRGGTNSSTSPTITASSSAMTMRASSEPARQVDGQSLGPRCRRPHLAEMEALDASLASSDVIILSMLFAF